MGDILKVVRLVKLNICATFSGQICEKDRLRVLNMFQVKETKTLHMGGVQVKICHSGGKRATAPYPRLRTGRFACASMKINRIH